MTGAILTLNVGSSSVKASLRPAGEDVSAPLWSGRVESIGADTVTREGTASRTSPEIRDHAAAIDWVIRRSGRIADTEIAAVGHRIVHGGAKYAAPTVIDDDVLKELRALAPLAPGHQPFNVSGVQAARTAFPGALQVACFDTAFHRTMPTIERLFALPREYAERGIARYGFHGLSYAYIASVLPSLLGSAADGRVIVGHLGAGVSLCAMRGRRSIATTMGFTALDGPPMGTRSGAIDPGVLLYLLQEEGMSAEQVSDVLYNRSGLLGVSGVSGDMRTLLESTDPRAAEAIELFTYRISREIGSLAGALGGLDALVFTGGVGENAAQVRARICDLCSWLGLTIDADANTRITSPISTTSSRVSAWVIPTDEEREIARETSQVVAANAQLLGRSGRA